VTHGRQAFEILALLTLTSAKIALTIFPLRTGEWGNRLFYADQQGCQPTGRSLSIRNLLACVAMK
jgi:hypothetical protein